MKQLITPFNIKIFDALRAYKEMEEIDWTIRCNSEVGDEVYFYGSNPYKKILMKGIVVRTKINYDEMIEDSKYYTNKNKAKSNNGYLYTRIKLEKIYTDEISNELVLEKLQENGLSGVLQSTRILDNNRQLQNYINKIVEI